MKNSKDQFEKRCFRGKSEFPDKKYLFQDFFSKLDQRQLVLENPNMGLDFNYESIHFLIAFDHW
jgi:hypothetical protein